MIGTVVSVKMEKTAVVSVERRYPHPLYHKIIRLTKKYKAHDANNTAVLGDVVRIEETRPLSKEKRWRIAATLVRGNVAEIAPREIGVPEEAIPPTPQPPVASVPRTPAEAQDETVMTTQSETLTAAADDLDATDYTHPAGTTAVIDSEGADQAESLAPEAAAPSRTRAARTPAEAAADETPMSSESEVLEAASDDMDETDYEESEGPKA
jgi:small subunit ribosomal protein S17